MKMLINVKMELAASKYEEFKKVVKSTLEQKQASEDPTKQAVDPNAENKNESAKEKKFRWRPGLKSLMAEIYSLEMEIAELHNEWVYVLYLLIVL